MNVHVILLTCLIWLSIWVLSSHLSNLLSATHTSGVQRGRKQLVTLSDNQVWRPERRFDQGLILTLERRRVPHLCQDENDSEFGPVVTSEVRGQTGMTSLNESPLELWECRERLCQLWTRNWGSAKWWKRVSPYVASLVKEKQNRA